MRPDLTPRQREVLNIIRESIRKRSYPPTLREIGAGLGMRSPNSVQRHLAILERKGYIRRDDGARRITLLGKGKGPGRR